MPVHNNLYLAFTLNSPKKQGKRNNMTALTEREKQKIKKQGYSKNTEKSYKAMSEIGKAVNPARTKTKKSEYVIIGDSTPVIDTVSVDIEQWEGQREFQRTRMKKMLTSRGGFDYDVFGLPTVVEFPDGRRVLLDGQHRLKLADKVGITAVPARIIKVDNDAHAATHFIIMNSTGIQKLSGEEIFINECIRGTQWHMELAIVMKRINWYISNGIKTFGADKDASGTMSIKVAGLKKMMKKTPAVLGTVAGIIAEVWPDDNTASVTLAEGLADLIHFIDDQDPLKTQFEQKYQTDLTLFLMMLAQGGVKQTGFGKQRYTIEDNNRGGTTAVGIYREWHDWLLDHEITPPFDPAVLVDALQA